MEKKKESASLSKSCIFYIYFPDSADNGRLFPFPGEMKQ
jgi:hypothetical protein